MQLYTVEDNSNEEKNDSEDFSMSSASRSTIHGISERTSRDTDPNLVDFEVPENKPSRLNTENLTVYVFPTSLQSPSESSSDKIKPCTQQSNLDSTISESFKSKVARSSLAANKNKHKEAKLALIKPGTAKPDTKPECCYYLLMKKKQLSLNTLAVEIKYIRKTRGFIPKNHVINGLKTLEKKKPEIDLGQNSQTGSKKLKQEIKNQDISSSGSQEGQSFVSDVIVIVTQNQHTPMKNTSQKMGQNLKIPSGQIPGHKSHNDYNSSTYNYILDSKIAINQELSLNLNTLSNDMCSIRVEFRKDSFVSEITTSPENQFENDKNLCSDQSDLSLCVDNHSQSKQMRLEDIDPFSNADYRELIDLDYLNTKQTKITRTSRAILIDWMMGASVEFELTRQAFCLAVNYADRYLSNTMNLEKSELHLIGLTCLSLAIKAEERVQMRLANVVEVTGNKFTPKEVSDLELQIWKTIGWRMNVPTIEVILYHYLLKWDEFVDGSCANSTAEYRVKFYEENLEAYRRFRRLTTVLDITKMHVDILKFDPRALVLSLIYIIVGNEMRQFDRENITSELESFSLEQDRGFNRYYSVFTKWALPSDKLELESSLKFLCKIFIQAPEPDSLDESTTSQQNTKMRFKDRLILQTHRKEYLDIAKKLLA